MFSNNCRLAQTSREASQLIKTTTILSTHAKHKQRRIVKNKQEEDSLVAKSKNIKCRVHWKEEQRLDDEYNSLMEYGVTHLL